MRSHTVILPYSAGPELCTTPLFWKFRSSRPRSTISDNGRTFVLDLFTVRGDRFQQMDFPGCGFSSCHR